MRVSARKLLDEKEPLGVRRAAYMLESVGTADDMRALIAAIDRAVSGIGTTNPEQWTFEIAPPQQACLGLVHAAEALASRGAEPAVKARTPGEIIHFVLAMKQRKDFLRVGWEKQCADWTRHELPYIRNSSSATPLAPCRRRLLERISPLLGDPDPAVVIAALQEVKQIKDGRFQADVRKVLATTTDSEVIHVAAWLASDLKIPTDEILGMLVDHLDSKELHFEVVNCLHDMLETGKKHDGLSRVGFLSWPGESRVR